MKVARPKQISRDTFTKEPSKTNRRRASPVEAEYVIDDMPSSRANSAARIKASSKPVPADRVSASRSRRLPWEPAGFTPENPQKSTRMTSMLPPLRRMRRPRLGANCGRSHSVEPGHVVKEEASQGCSPGPYGADKAHLWSSRAETLTDIGAATTAAAAATSVAAVAPAAGAVIAAAAVASRHKSSSMSNLPATRVPRTSSATDAAQERQFSRSSGSSGRSFSATTRRKPPPALDADLFAMDGTPPRLDPTPSPTSPCKIALPNGWPKLKAKLRNLSLSLSSRSTPVVPVRDFQRAQRTGNFEGSGDQKEQGELAPDRASEDIDPPFTAREAVRSTTWTGTPAASKKVRFGSEDDQIFEAFTPYGDVYGQHPSEFVFDADGYMVLAMSPSNASAAADLEDLEAGDKIQCTAICGVVFRTEPIFSAHVADLSVCDVCEEVEVLEHCDNWVRTEKGWLPLAMRGTPLFEVVGSRSHSRQRLGTSRCGVMVLTSNSCE